MVWTFTQALDWISKLSISIAGRIGMIVVWVGQQIRAFGENAVAGLVDQIEPLFPSVDWASVRTTLEGINYFFPLSECVTYGFMLLALWLVVFLYRLVKSWVRGG